MKSQDLIIFIFILSYVTKQKQKYVCDGDLPKTILIDNHFRLKCISILISYHLIFRHICSLYCIKKNSGLLVVERFSWRIKKKVAKLDRAMHFRSIFHSTLFLFQSPLCTIFLLRKFISK